MDLAKKNFQWLFFIVPKRISLNYLVFFFFYLSFSLAFPTPAWATCNPPQDYSSCPIARDGPKIAANIAEPNLAKVREGFNDADPAMRRQQIPVTVIYTPGPNGDLSEKNYEQTKGNLEIMKKNGLFPVIRIWDGPDDAESEVAGQVLNKLFNEVQFSQKPIVYGFNEPNLNEEGFQGQSLVFAQRYASLIKGAESQGQLSFRLYMSPMAGHQDGAEYTFAKNILDYTLPDGRKIGNVVDGAALTIYDWTADEFQSDLNKWTNLFRDYGVGQFMISELGPLKDGRLLQNDGDITEWTKKMSEIFRKLKTDPSFLGAASIINTSFFLDTDDDGFPDVTMLVIIDANGNVKVIQMPYIGGGFGWDQWIKPENECTAGDTKAPEGIFRPNPCKNCKLNVTKPALACAEPATFSKSTYWFCADLVSCTNGEGRIRWIKKESWDATFKLNAEDSLVDFADYKDITKNSQGQVTNLHHYLGSWLAGAVDDKNPVNPNNPQQLASQLNTVGAFSKLAPTELLNNLRTKMILSGLNYDVTDGKTTKKMQEWWPNKPLPPLPYPDGRLPPDKSDPLYLLHYAQWQSSEWGQLWGYMTPFSLEDSPGKVTLTIEHDPGTLTLTDAGEQMGAYSVEFPLAVPHLRRLYESSKELNNLVLPAVLAAQPKVEVMTAPVTEPGPQKGTSVFGECMETALGCIPVTAVGLVSWFVQYGSFVGGGLAFLLMAYGAFLLMTSSGDEEKVKQGKSIITAAIIGLLTIVGAVFLMRLITVQILKIPGFSQKNQLSPIQLTQDPEPDKTLLAQAHAQQASFASDYVLGTNTANFLAQVTPTPIPNQPAGQPESWFNITPTARVSRVGNSNQYQVGWQVSFSQNKNYPNWSGYDFTHFAFNVSINGQNMGGPTWTAEAFSHNPTYINDYYGVPSTTMGLKPGDKITIVVSITNGNQWGQALKEDVVGKTFTVICDVQADGSIKCPHPVASGGAVPDKCLNNSNLELGCSGNSPLDDPNPNDPICCNSQAELNVPDYRIVAFDNNRDYEKACFCEPAADPECKRDQKNDAIMSRTMKTDLEIPYLDSDEKKGIWQYLADEDLGLLNAFRPNGWPAYPDNDAVSNLKYQLISGDGVDLTPEGELYLPKLGGLNRSHQCIARQWLLPKDLQTNTSYCDFWGNLPKECPVPISQFQTTATPNTNPNLDQLLATAETKTGVNAKIIKAVLAIEGAGYLKNPLLNTCISSSCGAVGPMQITTGWQNVNCNPNCGPICNPSYCANGQIKEEAKDLFNAWDSYKDSGMNPCNLQDALIVGGRVLKAKGGGQNISLNDAERIVKASMGYYGNRYDDRLSAKENCHKDSKFAHLGNRNYCEYVFWHAGIENQIQ